MSPDTCQYPGSWRTTLSLQYDHVAIAATALSIAFRLHKTEAALSGSVPWFIKATGVRPNIVHGAPCPASLPQNPSVRATGVRTDERGQGVLPCSSLQPQGCFSKTTGVNLYTMGGRLCRAP